MVRVVRKAENQENEAEDTIDLPGIPVTNDMIPRFVRNLVNTKSNEYQLKKRWQGSAKKKTALNEVEYKETTDSELYSLKDANARILGERLQTPAKRTPLFMKVVETDKKAQEGTPSAKGRDLFQLKPKSEKKTPLTGSKRTLEDVIEEDTPLKNLGLKEESQKLSDKTPNTKRVLRRNILNNQLARLADEASESDEDAYFEGSDREEIVDEDGQEEQETISYEDYFSANQKLNKTSAATLDALETTLKFDDFKSILDSIESPNAKVKADFQSFYMLHAREWLLELSFGFNLLFFGFGSKKQLLEAFADKHLAPHGDVIVINGYFPSLNLRTILMKLQTDLLGIKQPCTGIITQQASHIVKHLNENKPTNPIFIVVNNIDGFLLRNQKTQSCLCELAACESIHLVASIDAMQASFLWDSYQMSRFNFIFQNVTSFLPYTYETADEVYTPLIARFFGGELSHNNAASVRQGMHVMVAITKNSRDVFRVLAQYQMKQEQEEVLGLSYRELFNACQEEFVISNDHQLQTALTEFQDHQLVTLNDTQDGKLYSIPMSTEDLKRLLIEAKLVEDEDV